MHPTRADEPTYTVTLTLRLTATVSFARGGHLADSEPILPSDAIANAIGRLPDDLTFGGEFDPALPIDGEATLNEGD